MDDARQPRDVRDWMLLVEALLLRGVLPQQVGNLQIRECPQHAVFVEGEYLAPTQVLRRGFRQSSGP